MTTDPAIRVPAPFYADPVAGITVYCADCRDVLPTLGGFDVVLTDPPYSEHVHGKSRRGGASAPPFGGNGRRAQCSFSRVKEFGFDSIDPETMRICASHFSRAKRWVLTFSDVELSHEWRDMLTASGLEYVRTGAWVKIGATPQFTGDRPAVGFEAITICHPRGRKRWNGGGTHAVWEYPIVLNRGGKTPRLHSTQKPLGLMLELVRLFSDPGDIIVDAFAGSGTTLVAAKMLGRQGIGIEKSPEHCRTIVERLDQTVADRARGQEVLAL